MVELRSGWVALGWVAVGLTCTPAQQRHDAKSTAKSAVKRGGKSGGESSDGRLHTFKSARGQRTTNSLRPCRATQQIRRQWAVGWESSGGFSWSSRLKKRSQPQAIASLRQQTKNPQSNQLQPRPRPRQSFRRCQLCPSSRPPRLQQRNPRRSSLPHLPKKSQLPRRFGAHLLLA